MRWDQDDQTLRTLGKNTQVSSDELRAMLQQLIDAAAPLEGRFNGAGRGAFDRLKSFADGNTGNLNRQVGSIREGQGGLETAFMTADTSMADEASSATSANGNLDASKLRGA